MSSGLRLAVLIFLITALLGCTDTNGQRAATKPEGEASLASASKTTRPAEAPIYVSGTRPTLTLYTVVNNRSGAGAHSALLINASEQVLFDPAGSFRHESLYERGDVLYGISPAWAQAFKSAHARSTYHVVSQEITVSPAQAERALQLAIVNGDVSAAFCTNSASQLLKKVPGFETTQVTFFPRNLMAQFEARGDAKTDRYYENDEGGVVDGILPAQG
ncbi:MAG: hypothetical protein AAF636_09610 [Pseudomonadota bacterium]